MDIDDSFRRVRRCRGLGINIFSDFALGHSYLIYCKPACVDEHVSLTLTKNFPLVSTNALSISFSTIAESLCESFILPLSFR